MVWKKVGKIAIDGFTLINTTRVSIFNYYIRIFQLHITKKCNFSTRWKKNSQIRVKRKFSHKNFSTIENNYFFICSNNGVFREPIQVRTYESITGYSANLPIDWVEIHPLFDGQEFDLAILGLKSYIQRYYY